LASRQRSGARRAAAQAASRRWSRSRRAKLTGGVGAACLPTGEEMLSATHACLAFAGRPHLRRDRCVRQPIERKRQAAELRAASRPTRSRQQAGRATAGGRLRRGSPSSRHREHNQVRTSSSVTVSAPRGPGSVVNEPKRSSPFNDSASCLGPPAIVSQNRGG
jgi:hypothetical protein